MVLRPKPDASYASVRLTKKNYTGQPLLSQVGGRKIREDSRYGKSDSQQSMKKKERPEPATDDEPLSSSDDESSDSQASLGSGKENGNSNTDSTKGNDGRSGGELQGIRRSARQKPAARQQQQEQQKSSPKRSFSQTLDQDEDEPFPEFMTSSQASKRRRNVSYGGYKNIHASSSFRVPSSSIENAVSSQKSSPGFKTPRKIPGVDESPVKKPEDSQDDGFKVPIDIDLDSPVSKGRTGSKKTEKGRDRSNSDSGFQMPPGPNDHDVAAQLSQGAGFKEPPPLPSNSISSSSLTSSNPMIDNDNDDLPSSSLSSISSSFSIPEDIAPSSKEKASEPATNQSLCPMCKEPVDPALLQEFLAQSDQRVREQERFCERHKKKSAQKEWIDKGYPTIDWDTFDERIRRHFPSLEKILVPDSHSFYRNILDSTMKAGKAKNFRLTVNDDLENLSCGYYGSKGASRMLVLPASLLWS